MQVITPERVKDKKVLLRLDLDVPLDQATGGRVQVAEDFRLKAAVPTIKMCLENAEKVVMMGHLGRPKGKESSLSLKPVAEWLEKELGQEIAFLSDLGNLGHLSNLKLVLLENLRFNPGEDTCDPEFAKKLAQNSNFYINEAFASHHKSASTTVLPSLFPHVKNPEGRLWPRRAAGLRFFMEVEKLTQVRNSPKKPFVVIIGGVKIEDKLPAVLALARSTDAVLVGGLLAQNIKDSKVEVPMNVMVGKLSDSGIDMAEETIDAFIKLIKNAKQIIWAGPVGKYEESTGNIGNKKLAEAILNRAVSGARVVIGGGDTISALVKLDKLEQLDKLAFISVGGGAMLKFLTDGTLPTIQALE